MSSPQYPRDVLLASSSPSSSTPRTLFPVVLAADNYPSPSPYIQTHPSFPPQLAHLGRHETYVPFHLTLADFQARLAPIGWLRDEAVAAMSEATGPGGENVWTFLHSGEDGDDEMEGREGRLECVFFADWVVRGGSEQMGQVMKAVVEKWKVEGLFKEALGGWRNELYSIYASPSSSIFSSPSSRPMSNVAFPLERSACAVFGMPTVGVHCTAYEGEGVDMKVWVPRRSATKETWPSRLDNTVAGGIPHGLSPLESMVKECDEEASLPDDLVRRRLKNVGVKTYFYITPGGLLQPEIEYIYDLPLPPQNDPTYVKPHPHDNEVESFALLSIPQVIAALHTGDFKPNCGLILVDFLMRHGFVTPENEPNYIDISARMHRRLEIALPGA